MEHPGNKLQAVLFDLDGTLVDTADDFVPVVQQLRAEADREPMDPLLIRANVSNGARALVRLALEIEEQDAAFEQWRLRLLELYGDIVGRFARPYPGVRKLLTMLEERQIHWGVVTNKPRAYAEPLLEALQLNTKSLVCPDDVVTPKPHPESLQKACAELDCAEANTIYVGDHSRDIEAGRRANMYTIAAGYGYIAQDDDPRRWGADCTIADSHDLAREIFTEESIP